MYTVDKLIWQLRKLGNLQEDEKHPTNTNQNQEKTSGIHTESRFGRDLCKFDHFYHKLHSSRPVQLRGGDQRKSSGKKRRENILSFSGSALQMSSLSVFFSTGSEFLKAVFSEPSRFFVMFLKRDKSCNWLIARDEKQKFYSSIWHPYPNIKIWTLHFLHKYGETFCLLSNLSMSHCRPQLITLNDWANERGDQ
jgi:hypothetical protein